MPARKQQPINQVIPSLDELIRTYDQPTLARALGELKTSIGWQILRAALMQEYLRTVSYQLDLASKTGTQIEAAYQAGSAQTMFDTANTLIPQYIQKLEGKTGVVEAVRPEE